MIPRLPILLLLGAVACGGGEEPESWRPDHRLLVVGWDGATFDLIDPLIEAGRLPNLARLCREGRTAALESTIVPISSSAWVGATTGMGPGRTGVYSFFEPVEGTYDVQVISSHSVEAAPIWRILTGRGLGVVVFGVPVTWPAEPVDGTLVAGMLSPFDSVYAWPPEYTDELRATGFVPDLGIWREEQALTQSKIDEQLAIKERAVVGLLGRDDWDFSMVVFKNLDVLSHRAYDGSLDGPVAALCDSLDATLGRMIEAAGPDTNVIVMSDHGFRAYPRGFNLHRWLVEEGYAVEREDVATAGASAGPLAEARALEHRRRIGELDLTKTRAFATTSEGNYGSLRLNLAGREPNGTVAAADAEALLAEIEERLAAVEFPAGSELVRTVVRGKDRYPGPHSAIVPDLIVEVAEDCQVVSTNRQQTFMEYPSPFPDHALDGIFVAAGPGIAGSSGRGRMSVLDLAPTALHLLKQPVHTEMTGTVREELLAVPRPVRRMAIADDPTYREPEAARVPLTEQDLRKMLERLKALGYVD